MIKRSTGNKAHNSFLFLFAGKSDADLVAVKEKYCTVKEVITNGISS